MDTYTLIEDSLTLARWFDDRAFCLLIWSFIGARFVGCGLQVMTMFGLAMVCLETRRHLQCSKIRAHQADILPHYGNQVELDISTVSLESS